MKLKRLFSSLIICGFLSACQTDFEPFGAGGEVAPPAGLDTNLANDLYVNETGDTMSGPLAIIPSSNSISALDIQDASSNWLFRVDTTNRYLAFSGEGTSPDVAMKALTGSASQAGLNIFPFSGSNISSLLNVFPKGSGTGSINLFGTDFIADPVNIELLQIIVSSVANSIVANANGSGVVSPIDIYTIPNIFQLRLATDGRVGLSTFSPAGKFHVDGSKDEHQVYVESHSTQIEHPFVVATASKVERVYVDQDYTLNFENTLAANKAIGISSVQASGATGGNLIVRPRLSSANGVTLNISPNAAPLQDEGAAFSVWGIDRVSNDSTNLLLLSVGYNRTIDQFQIWPRNAGAFSKSKLSFIAPGNDNSKSVFIIDTNTVKVIAAETSNVTFTIEQKAGQTTNLLEFTTDAGALETHLDEDFNWNFSSNNIKDVTEIDFSNNGRMFWSGTNLFMVDPNGITNQFNVTPVP